MRLSETWAEAMVVKADLTQQIIGALCEGADAGGFSPGWCTAIWQGLSSMTADQLAQATQRTEDEGGPLNSEGEISEMDAEYACGPPVVLIDIDNAGQVTYLGIGLT
jgi:hypothetical protein